VSSAGTPYRILISGGGTGGHVYPALAIADTIRRRYPDAQIEFVGAEGRMEMEKVPMYGYKIHGLWISGIQRKNMLKNILLPFKIFSSLQKVKRIVSDFKPQAAVGVGGYASGPLLRVAAARGVKTLLQEQNSFPGITNKLLAGKANKICVAYPGLEKFFPKEKIIFTGNPVRQFTKADESQKSEAYKYFGLDENLPTVLIIGGSLGARTINNSIISHINEFAGQPVQLLWQTGKFYYETIKAEADKAALPNVKVLPFIDKMEYAYAIADVVVSRAGAISISELSLVQKPVILVPSPNVAEDHQTKNASVLADAYAAIMIKDSEAQEKLVPAMLELVNNTDEQQRLSQNIGGFAKPNAADSIVDELIKLIENKN
jgi:UDP-N-acetylglucosamine--N-acetylmuramyl-(pentapeptide) pyrophosphoryl-undecaprenol N-acetylglucosamine transferase